VGSWLLAAAGLVLVAAYAVAYMHVHIADRPTGVDTLGFHLPAVIRFIQTGSLWHTTQYISQQAQGNYPQYGDLMLLAAVLPWRSVALVRYVDPVLLAIAVLGVYAIGRELQASASAALIAACSLVAIGPICLPAFRDQLTDPTFLAAFSAGVLFLLRHWRTARRSDLVLAGVGLGIALGTKWYGLTDVPAVVVVWAGAWLVARRPWRRLAGDGSVLLGTIAASGGVWLLRNLILTGDPVFNYKFSLFGVTIFDAPPDPIRQRIGFSLAHYAGHPSILRKYIWPVFRTDFGLAAAVIVAGALVTFALVLVGRLRGHSTRIDPRIAMLAVAAGALAVAYAITPYGAQGIDGAPTVVNSNTRYGVPALLVAAPLLAWLAGRLGRAGLALEALLLLATLLGLRDHLPSPTGQVVAAAVVLSAAIALAWWLRRTRPSVIAGSLRPRFRTVAAGAAAVVLAGLVAVTYHYQRSLAARPYSPDDQAVSYVLANAPSHSRIAITGQWTAVGLVPVAPLFGPRLDNDVQYVGPFVEHLRREYQTPSAFQAALRHGHYRILVVGTGFPPVPHPMLELWARGAGFVPVAHSSRLIALRAPAS
jgi:hypothetical protein